MKWIWLNPETGCYNMERTIEFGSERSACT